MNLKDRELRFLGALAMSVNKSTFSYNAYIMYKSKQHVRHSIYALATRSGILSSAGFSLYYILKEELKGPKVVNIVHVSST